MDSRDFSVLKHMLRYCNEIQNTLDRFGRDIEIFKNDNDYFILSEYVLINNINKNKNLLLILLTKLKHYKYKKRPINKIIYEIFKNKQVVFL